MVGGGRLACVRRLLDSRRAGGGARRAHSAGATVAYRRYSDRRFFPCHDSNTALAPCSELPHSALAARDSRCGNRLLDRHHSIDWSAQRAGLHVLWLAEGRFSFDGGRQLTCIDGQQSRDLPATRRPSASRTLAGPHCWGIRHGRLICRKSDRPAHEHSHIPISCRCTALLLRSFPPLGSL